jgi:hypothetical protein
LEPRTALLQETIDRPGMACGLAGHPMDHRQTFFE